MEKLLEYMSFRAHYETVGPKEEIPVHEFMERIAPEIVLELLVPPNHYARKDLNSDTQIPPRLLAADYQDGKAILTPAPRANLSFAQSNTSSANSNNSVVS